MSRKWAIRRPLLLSLLPLITMLVVGCPPAETQTVRTLGSSKGLIETEMGKHGECNPASGAVPQTSICTALNRAIPAQHAAVLLLDTYCSSTDYLTNHGTCTPPTDPAAKKELQVKLSAAVNNLKPLIDAVKAAAGGKS